MLRDLGLEPFAKVTGSRGIHIVAPLKRTRTADEVRERAGEIAERIAAERPDTLTTFWRKEKREGRILVDVARNTYGQTIVAPYAVRALPGAPVAMPVRWDEVADAGLAPAAVQARATGGAARRAAIPGRTWTPRAKALPDDLSAPSSRYCRPWGSSTRPRSSPSRRRPSSTRCRSRSTRTGGSGRGPAARSRSTTSTAVRSRSRSRRPTPPHGDPLARRPLARRPRRRPARRRTRPRRPRRRSAIRSARRPRRRTATRSRAPAASARRRRPPAGRGRAAGPAGRRRPAHHARRAADGAAVRPPAPVEAPRRRRRPPRRLRRGRAAPPMPGAPPEDDDRDPPELRTAEADRRRPAGGLTAARAILSAMRPYEGLLTAMVTPFRADGSVDEEGAVAIGRHLLANGSHGLVVAGTTGEAATMTDEEHLGLIELIVRELGDEGVVIGGTGSNDTRHADPPDREGRRGRGGRGALRHAVLQQARTGAGSSRTSREVAEAAGDTPVVLYNIPSRTATNMPPDLLAELAQIDGIEAVKQANSDELQLIDGLAVLAGNDDIYGRCLEIGGVGGICVASHVVGNEMRRMYDEPEARAEIDASLQEVYAAMFVTASPAPVKAALKMLGHDTGPLRLPLVECDEAERTARARRARPARAPDRGHRRVSGKLRVLPLGGVGEIGKNMTVVEYDGRIVVVDCGLRFPTAEMMGIDLVLPDFTYLRDNVDRDRRDHHHARPRGSPRRAAVGDPRPRPGQDPGRLQRPADDRDGALEAGRAQAARRARSRCCRSATSSRPARSSSSAST